MSDYNRLNKKKAYRLLQLFRFLLLQPVDGDEEVLDLGPSAFRKVFLLLREAGAAPDVPLVEDGREIPSDTGLLTDNVELVIDIVECSLFEVPAFVGSRAAEAVLMIFGVVVGSIVLFGLSF